MAGRRSKAVEVEDWRFSVKDWRKRAPKGSTGRGLETQGGAVLRVGCLEK